MKPARILFFDVETKPVKAWIWRVGEQAVRHDQIVDGERFAIICIAWKWLGRAGVEVRDWHNERRMLQDFKAAVESADLLIGQNIDSFDVKQVNLQMLLHKLEPIAWPPTEDTRKLVRKNFYSASTSLKYMSKLLGGQGKDRMEFADWIAIIEKNCPKALTKMLKYCKRDVLETEYVWKEIEPHCAPSAKVRAVLTYGAASCPACACKRFTVHSYKGSAQRRHCGDCGRRYTVSRQESKA